MTIRGKIALAKTFLIPKITAKLLKGADVSVNRHLIEEFKRAIVEQAIKTFDLFFKNIEEKRKKFRLSLKGRWIALEEHWQPKQQIS